MTVYGKFFNEPKIIAHTKWAGICKPACKASLNPCALDFGFMRLEALLELQNPRIDKESVMFGFTGSFMMILSFMWTLSCFIDHASSPWPRLHLSSLLPFLNNKTKKRQEQVAKTFSELKQAHVGMDPKKPTKLDGNDTTTLSLHPYILCQSRCQLCTLQNSLYSLSLNHMH